MGRGATSTLRAGPRIGVADAARALVAALGFGATAFVLVYVAVRAGGQLIDGDGNDAARWATLSFAAAVPFGVGYAALEARRVALASMVAPAAVIAGCLVLQG